MIAHIDLDSFFVSVERARNPDLAGRPIVIGGRRGGGGLVAAASREARRAGIRPGTPLVQASILCADAVFLDGAFDVYLEAALEVDDVLRKVSPEIEWVSIDEAYMGFARTASPRAVVERLDTTQQEVRRLGLDAAFGIGRSRTVARIASRLARPRGVLHVLEGYEARFLSPLKIEMLPDLDTPIARRLRAGGIRRLGQLATLSEPQLASLAGRAGLNLVRQATGRDSTTVRRAALQMGPIEDDRLPEPTADPAAITQAVRSCVSRLSRTLQSRRAFARSMTVRMRYADGRVESRTAPLPQPSAFVDVLEAAAADLVVRLDRPGHLVRAVGVSISGLVEGSGLFPLRR